MAGAGVCLQLHKVNAETNGQKLAEAQTSYKNLLDKNPKETTTLSQIDVARTTFLKVMVYAEEQLYLSKPRSPLEQAQDAMRVYLS